MNLTERVQYKAALIVSGCWQGTSREKLYEELDWESLSDRRWARRLTILYEELDWESLSDRRWARRLTILYEELDWESLSDRRWARRLTILYEELDWESLSDRRWARRMTILYEELDWESLSDRRWARRLTIFYKINNGLAPFCLSDHIPKRNEINFNLRNRNDNIPLLRAQRYKNSFFPYTIKS